MARRNQQIRGASVGAVKKRSVKGRNNTTSKRVGAAKRKGVASSTLSKGI